MTLIVVTGTPPGPLFFDTGLISSGAYEYYSTNPMAVGAVNSPPLGSILTQHGGNKFYNGSSRPNSAEEVARFIAGFLALRSAIINNLESSANYTWIDPRGISHIASGLEIKVTVSNISWVFVDGIFLGLNGGVGMNQNYGGADPRSQVTIDLASAVAYTNAIGGLNYIVMHEAFHSSFFGRSGGAVYVSYSPEWNFREQAANDYAKAIATAAGLPVTDQFDPRNPGYSH